MNPGDALTEIERLEAELRITRRALWCVVRQVGGEVSLSPSLVASAAPDKAVLTVVPSPDTLKMIIRAELKP